MILLQKLSPAAQNQNKWEVEAILSEAEEKARIFFHLHLTRMENLCSFTTSLALISNFLWSIDALAKGESPLFWGGLWPSGTLTSLGELQRIQGV